jgi:DNA polymerase-3 subunit beta
VKAGRAASCCKRCLLRFSTAAKPGEQARFALPQKGFKRLLSLVQYAMAQQDIRYYLNGLLFVVDAGQLRLVATDGHRLAYAAMPLEAAVPRQEVIVPRKTVLELTKLLGDGDEEARIELSASRLRFPSIGGTGVEVVDGKFPDYTRVIPGNRNALLLERESLRQALLRAAICPTKSSAASAGCLHRHIKIVPSNRACEADEV